MLGFTLSKFSLLILVVAIFSIVAFFTMHLTESLKIKSLNDMLSNKSSIASEMMSSPSYCDELLIKIPETVKLSTSEMYYVLKISVQESSRKNYLIFSAADRRSPEKQIAASSSPTTAIVEIYNQEQSLVSDKSEGIILDPSARSNDPNLADAFYLVKEMNPEGKVVLYVFPCVIGGGLQSNCDNAKDVVGSRVHGADVVKKFKCG